MEAIVLASSSPRRQEILKSLQIPFITAPPACEEWMPESGDAAEIAEKNAKRKLKVAVSLLQQSGRSYTGGVLSADTIVAKGKKIFGKPKTRDEAAAMLKAFSAKSHEVVTALCFLGKGKKRSTTKVSRTVVSFMELSAGKIEKYLDTGEWQGAAGGYKIQGLASCFITSIKGSYTGAVGLPVHLLYELLLENNCGFIV